MGYIAHDAVIATVCNYMESEMREAVDAFRAGLPERWRGLVVGPIPAITNGGETYFFAPDGSKEGWDTSDEGDEYRAQFIALFSYRHEDDSSPHDVVTVRYGRDHGAEVGVTAGDPYSSD